MGSVNKGVKIQRGFVAGIVAVCVMSIATGLVLKYGSISASSFGEGGGARNYCLTRGVGQTEVLSATPTSEEINTFGQRAKAFNIKINEKQASFRFVLSAKELEKIGDGGRAKIDIGLTFIEGLGKEVWGGNGDSVHLTFKEDESSLIFQYNRASRNQLLKKSFEKSFTDYQKGDFDVEFIGRNYDGCIQTVNLATLLGKATGGGNDLIVASATPSPNVSSTATPTLSPTDSCAGNNLDTGNNLATEGCALQEPDGYQTLTLRPGFNAYSLSPITKILTTQDLIDAGMTVWVFNREADKKWYTPGPNSRVMLPSIGYYIYNPGTTSKSIEVPFYGGESISSVWDGWNLLSNSNTQPKKLNELEYYIDGCPPANQGQISCTSVGHRTNLSAFFTGVTGEGDGWRAHPVILVVDDPYTSDPDKAFKEIRVTEQNRETVEIPAGKLFWIYIWP